MFKFPSLVPVETLSGLLSDRVRTHEMSPLSRAVYRELAVNEPDTIEQLLSFYQGDAQHEHLMDELSTEVALAVTAFLGKVHNEVLDLVDSTFEEVNRCTKDETDEVITHRLHIIPEITFLSTSVAEEIASVNISSMARIAIEKGLGGKFESRNSTEIFERIAKTMSSEDFEEFRKMVSNLQVDIVQIYNAVVVGIESKPKPLEQIGHLGIPYTYLEAVVGYHIIRSLIDEPDLQTRMTEIEYNNYLSAKLNNLQIRYGQGSTMIEKKLNSDQDKMTFKIEGDIVVLNLYEPSLKRIEDDENPRDSVIHSLLAAAVTHHLGPVPGIKSEDRYDYYRREIKNRKALALSQSTSRQLAISLEKFINGGDFDSWFSINKSGDLTPTLRTQYLDEMRAHISKVSIGTESELYSTIIAIVTDVLYKKPAISRFIGDVRILMQNGDTPIQEAFAAAADKAVVNFYMDMLKVV